MGLHHEVEELENVGLRSRSTNRLGIDRSVHPANAPNYLINVLRACGQDIQGKRHNVRHEKHAWTSFMHASRKGCHISGWNTLE